MSTRERTTRTSEKESSTSDKGELREWGEALVVAVLIVLVVRLFLFDLFRIPSPSMEENLLVGDYLVVSKLHYGTRLPLTLGIPLTSIYVPGISFPYERLPGFSSVQRGDPIVFNYPPDEAPIDRKVHYIKRVIGMPGESISVRDKVVHIDGEPLPLGRGMQQNWIITKEDARYQIPRLRMDALGISRIEPTQQATKVRIQATPAAIQTVSEWSWVESVKPYVVQNADYGDEMYPAGRGYTPDNYGPVHIPAKGETITLTDKNWPVYRPVIVRHEGRSARQMTDSTFAIDGERTTTYTFQQDYFFAMGDNRDNSKDSRFWGFVPMDHVVGKAVITYFSWDAEEWLPRFRRIMNPIEDDEVFRETTVLKQLADSVTVQRGPRGVGVSDDRRRERPSKRVESRVSASAAVEPSGNPQTGRSRFSTVQSSSRTDRDTG